jgi:transcriptional regulator GlxA family with amidase domain
LIRGHERRNGGLRRGRSSGRFFQKNAGRSFTDYLAELRIGRACRLLAETQQPVSGICYEVG